MRAAAAIVGLALAACNPYGRTVRDPIPRLEAPNGAQGRTAASRRRGGEAPAVAATGDRWWRAFRDPALDAVVEAALDDNLQVRAAWARIEQARQLGTQARSTLWPQIGAQVDATRRRSMLVLPNFTDPEGPETVRALESDTFSLSLPVSYELDVFGRAIALGRAAHIDVEALHNDLQALATTIAASTVEAWFTVVYQRALRLLLAAQLETSESHRRLVELRFREGLGSALDVYNQRAQVEGVRAQLALTVAQAEVAGRQLAVLVGRTIAEGLVPEDKVDLPELAALPRTGIAAELLVHRPDLRAARRRVESSDERVAAAFAERFPRIVLSGSAGFSSNEIDSLLDRFVYTFGASLQAPVWDGDRRRSAVAQNRAAVWERIEQLAQTWLVALHEVDSAIVQERQQRVHIEALGRRAAAARAALEEARQRFTAGLLPDYLNVLAALNGAQQAEQQVLAARRQIISYRTGLHRALGGDLSGALTEPEPRPIGGRPRE